MFAGMRQFIMFIALYAFAAVLPAFGQDGLNSEADNIIGIYYVAYGGEESKVRFSKADDGTYTAQTIWLKNRLDKNGEVRKDVKNPDKSLRNVPCDSIVIITGMKYNPGKLRWDGGKVYDPTRGIRANATCFFKDDGTFCLKGSLLGISQTVEWKKMTSDISAE